MVCFYLITEANLKNKEEIMRPSQMNLPPLVPLLGNMILVLVEGPNIENEHKLLAWWRLWVVLHNELVLSGHSSQIDQL